MLLFATGSKLLPAHPLAQRLWGNAYLLLIVTTLLWSGNAVASRLALGNISPMALTSLRWVIVCGVLCTLLRRDLAAAWPVLWARRGYIVLLGALGFTAFNALMYLAAYSTTAVNIGILQGAIPVFVLVGAFLLYRTPIGALQALGVLVTLVGVAVTASHGSLAALMALEFSRGDVWMVLATVLYAGYTVGLRSRPALPGLVFFTALAAVACVASLPLLIAEIAANQFYWPSPAGWAVLLYVAIGPSLVAQLTFMRAVELIGPGRAGVFVNLVPVFAPMMAVLILNEPFGLYHAVALVLVLGGIFIAERMGRARVV